MIRTSDALPAQHYKTKRVSVSSQGKEGNWSSYSPSLSATGRYAAFDSDASNLVFKDVNGVRDIFLYDRKNGETKRISVSTNGAEAIGEYSEEIEETLGSSHPSISGNGNLVAFESFAANLVEGDRNGAFDVFVHNVKTGVTERISVNGSGEEGNFDSNSPRISESGRFVAYDSVAGNLVLNDGNGYGDVFVFDRKTGITERVSVANFGEEGNDASFLPSISATGRYVAFLSNASNLVDNDNNDSWDVFVHDRKNGSTKRVSINSAGVEANGFSYPPAISGNGRYVAFSSWASNLVFGDNNDAVDVFVHDLKTGETKRVSVDSSGHEGNQDSINFYPSLSRNGRIVTFSSNAGNLVVGDKNGSSDVFVHNLKIHKTRRISVNMQNIEGNSDSYEPVVSSNGLFIGFSSYASNLIVNDHNDYLDTFVRHR